MTEEAAAVEKKLLEEYGAVSRWNGSLGVCFIPTSSVVRYLLTLSHRKNACGSQIPRQSTISSKVPTVYTRKHSPSGKWVQLSWVGVSPRSTVNCLLPHAVYFLISDLRRCT